MPPKPRTLSWPTAIVIVATVAAIAAVLILAHGDTQEALLAILGALGTGLAALLPRLVGEGSK